MKKTKGKLIKDNHGITLIALVVTIVILLILAGITINLLLAEGGIFGSVEKSAEEHEKGAAREKLEIALVALLTDKYRKPEKYNDDYVDSELSKQSMIVIENIVTVNGWQFIIDKSVPKIIEELGKGEFNDNIIISAEATPTSDFIKATITVEIEYEGELTSVKISEVEEKTELTKGEANTYTITFEEGIDKNKTYTIIATDTEGKQQISSVAVTGISEDLDIYTAQQLADFRDRVNLGATYEGRTVRLMADIELNKYTVENGTITFANDAEQWTPIGNYGENSNLKFRGTFKGQNHKITGMYIKNDNSYQGLFGLNEGEISDLIIEGQIKSSGTNSTLSGDAYIGAIAGMNSGGKIESCINKVTIEERFCITNTIFLGGIVGNNQSTDLKTALVQNCINEGKIINSGTSEKHIFTGGIVARNSGEINACINIGKVTNTNSSIATTANYVGGIIAQNVNCVQDCTNKGEVENQGSGILAMTGGIAGQNNNGGQIINCSNEQTITDSATANQIFVGGISGNNQGSSVLNCYNIEQIKSTGTGSEYAAAGGITGVNNVSAKVSNCYNRGNIVMEATVNDYYKSSGGIVGTCDTGSVNLCYNTGSITNTGTGTTYTGGIIGIIQNNPTIANGYYLLGTAVGGINSSDTTEATGKTENYMKSEEFVILLNSLLQTGYLEWEITTIYPVLKSN